MVYLQFFTSVAIVAGSKCSKQVFLSLNFATLDRKLLQIHFLLWSLLLKCSRIYVLCYSCYTATFATLGEVL